MKQILFYDMVEGLARSLVARPEFADLFETLGIFPEQWPQVKAKAVAQTYLELRERKGHDYAAYILADDAAGLAPWTAMPREPLALRNVYADEFKKFRLVTLANEMAICTDAEQIEFALSKYTDEDSKTIEVYNFFDESVNIIRNNHAAVAAGTAIVELPDWPLLSNMIGGMNPGRVSLLVASTGFGKTNLALALARSAAKRAPTLFINMEMIAQDIGERILVGEARMPLNSLKTGISDASKVEAAVLPFESRRLAYTGGRALSANQIFSLARVEKKKGMQFLFIDYDQKIQLQTSRETPEWKALQLVVEQIESLAKELGIWICLLSQSDDNGDPSASKRSKYPASSVLRFYESDGRPVIQAVKNRFGRHNAAVEIDYRPECAYAAEKCVARIEDMKPERRTFETRIP